MPVLLIYPPVAKPGEPPPGIAKLMAALNQHGVEATAIDANLEALIFAAASVSSANDTWTRRAIRGLDANLAFLRDQAACRNPDRYKRAVHDIQRLLGQAGSGPNQRIGLAEYQDPSLSPVRSADLIRAAENYQQNPFYSYFRQRLLPVVERIGPSIIGLSITYLDQALCAFAMIGFFRKLYPQVRIILGGGLITAWLKRSGFKSPFTGLVDEMAAGPGEAALLEFVGKTVQIETTCPDYAPFAQTPYLSPGFVLPYSASSGCYWNRCAFCPEKVHAPEYRPIAPARVKGDLDILSEKFHPSLIHFLDNALHPATLKFLAQNPLRIPWYGFARIGSLLTDADFCRALRRSGCVMLKLGLESADEHVLEGMQKGIDPQTISNCLHALKAAGIAVYAYLLFGTPWENLQSAEKTLEFTAGHAGQIDFLNLAVFNLPAHSPDAENLEVRNFYEGDLCLYQDFVHPAGWNRTAVRRFLDKRFRRRREIAAILRNTPPVFTSNHAPFFVMAGRQ